MPDIAAQIRRNLPPDVGFGVGHVLSDLWPGEVLPNAVPARLNEFRAGRNAARAAMRDLGLPAQAIPIGPDRAPIWPDHMVGSISHCTGACFAIVGETHRFEGLGLDIEPMVPMSSDLWEVVLRPEELAAVQQLHVQDQGITALRIFVAKEATYKAQYCRSRQLFDFQTILITQVSNRFSARFQRDIAGFPTGSVLNGALVSDESFQAAVCWIDK